jgi:hypothetical protein
MSRANIPNRRTRIRQSMGVESWEVYQQAHMISFLRKQRYLKYSSFHLDVDGFILNCKVAEKL